MITTFQNTPVKIECEGQITEKGIAVGKGEKVSLTALPDSRYESNDEVAFEIRFNKPSRMRISGVPLEDSQLSITRQSTETKVGKVE